MSFEPDNIVQNAQCGQGACKGCPAYEAHHGEFVNPGLLNPDAEIMFLTLDPSHRIDWDTYESWTDYNAEFSLKFASWPGGKKIQEIIDPLGLTLDDVWLGDSVKCPVDNSLFRFSNPDNINQAFDHCQEYLATEIQATDPKVIVPLGEDAAIRLLDVVFSKRVPQLKTGTTDCGRVFDTNPPVIISPHWSHGWLDRSPTGTRNLEIVQDALIQTFNNV